MHEQVNDSGTGNASFGFVEFLATCEALCVPRIQRAYAQGRDDALLIRNNLLQDVFQSLAAGRTLELNFVYGAVKNGRFEILDGQQRLTTLFLLHWYCANAELGAIPDELGKLKYETRPTSGYFIQDLVSRKIALGDKCPSAAIRNTRWFSHAYGCDPTVLSMLGMLDAIHVCYRKYVDLASEAYPLYDRLGLIRFYRHPLDGFNRTDELYIKMNARGLPLTPFENFKADLVDWLQRQDAGYYVSRVTVGGREMRWQMAFPVKIDTEWTQYFWRRTGNCREEDLLLSARMFRVFIRYAFYRFLTSSTKTDDDMSGDPTLLFLDDGEKGAESQVDVYLGFEAFKRVLESDGNMLYDLDHVIDILRENKLSFEQFDALLMNPHDDVIWSWVGKKKDFQRRQAIAFAAAFAYLEGTPAYEPIGFGQWMRVVWNAITNYNVDNLVAQIRLTRALVRIARTPGLTKDVYGTLATLAGDVSLRSLQEEVLKAKLIVGGPEDRAVWESEIVDAEHAPFFKGMIGFYVHDGMTLQTFRHRRENVMLLFDDAGISPAFREHHCLLRAMLAQIPFWKNGVAKLTLTENRVTADAYLKDLLAASAPIQGFFRSLTDLADADEMRVAIENAYAQIPVFVSGENGEAAAAAQLFYSRLVGDERVLDWVAHIESVKHKCPVVEFRNNHYMLNARKSWSARILLDVEREEMARILINDLGFALTDGAQNQSLAQYGYFTDADVALFKIVNGHRFTVCFKTFHACEISYPGRASIWQEYGMMASFAALRQRIEAELAAISDDDSI